MNRAPASREPSTRLRVLLACMDSHMSTRADAQLGWVEISCALGLGSVSGKTVTQLAGELGITKQAVFKGATKFLRMSGLPPAFGMKSEEARAKYRETNGRHDYTA